jgi:hypothetical protein
MGLEKGEGSQLQKEAKMRVIELLKILVNRMQCLEEN